MATALFLLFLWLYGYYYGRFRYQVHHQTISFYDLPAAFDGYKIVQFSDLHIGSFRGGYEIEVQRIADLINAQHADMVVFTGDLVNRLSSELDGFHCMLSDITAPDGVFSILGNHDYALYASSYTDIERLKDKNELIRRQRSYGWTMLLNENAKITRGHSHIYIAGVENQGYAKQRFPRRADLPKALRGIRRGDFTILLSHDPTHWRHDITGKTSIQLMLAGHTHAGQFKIFGWSPVSWVYPEWSGTYVEGPQVLNVSDGVGCLIPFRYGAWPEINVITLRRAY
ncbi:MAG: metallophosphoesterase [Bacteroidaceae bacterium]|nr:metallophosphoesterase [Bacteroidaceae bacterium]MBQ9640002.1 metallophosphoesterase [Bacteroidaceae bacterium]